MARSAGMQAQLGSTLITMSKAKLFDLVVRRRLGMPGCVFRAIVTVQALVKRADGCWREHQALLLQANSILRCAARLPPKCGVADGRGERQSS